MKKKFQKIATLLAVLFCFLLANQSYSNIKFPAKVLKSFSKNTVENLNLKSPLKINGVVFPITINPFIIPNLKLNQTADYTFSYLVSNTKNVPAKSYVWVDFDNNGVYTANEAIVTNIPANAVDFKVDINYLNANFINNLKIGVLNIKFTTTTTTLIDNALTANIDERSTSLGVDGETESFAEKSIAGIAISGSVFIDGNSISDGVIFGTGVGVIEGVPLNAYLIDNTNNVISKTIFTLGGSYKFENLYKGNYTVAISLNNYANGTPIATIVPNFPTGWNLAGESYGSIGNLPLGIEPGLPNMQIPIVTQTATGGTDIFGVNFAVNRTPIASNDEIATPINTPVLDCNLTANDTDPDGNQTIDKTSILLIDPLDGLKKTTVTVAGKGEFKVNPAGEVSFVPVNNFLGVMPVITYTVKDKGGIESNFGSIKLVVKPIGVNDVKIIDNPLPSITINILSNDGISGVLAVPAETFSNPANATVVANANGDITFVFPANQKLPDTYVYTYVLKTTDGVYSDPITATIIVAYSPAITLTKTATFNDTNNDGLAQAGETITYGFQVTNSGNVDVINVTVSDPKINLVNAAIVPNTLKPGETGFLTIVPNLYVITPADIIAGQVLNTATSTGLEPLTNKIVNSSSDAIVIFPVLKLKLVKSSTIIDVNNNGFTDIGDKIEYTFTVTNTGTVPVINIGINDPKIGIVNELITPSTLAPGATGTLKSAITYTITLADILKGFVSNKATADGTNIQNTPVSADSENGNLTTKTDPTCPTCTITEIVKKPQISLVKTAVFNDLNSDTFAQVGETVTYTFNVTNTGNVNINNITIKDVMLGLVNTPINPANLNPTQVGTFSVNYILTQADIDKGSLTNSAIAIGVDDLNTSVTDTSGTSVNNNTPTVIIIVKAPSITLVKSSTIIDANNNGLNDVGDKIEYTFTVKNTGEQIIKNISITDAKIGLVNELITPSTLAIGATGVLKSAITYTITQADFVKGFVSNTATANGTNELNAPVSATSSNGNTTTTVDPACPTCTITDIIKKPRISLVKTAVFNDLNSDTFAQVGESVTYTFKVTNTGNVNINNITLSDAMLSMVNVPINPTNLIPTQVGTYTINYILTQADINKGSLTNSAIASGIDPLNIPVSDTSGTSIDNNTPTVIIIIKAPYITLVKSSTLIDANNNGLNDAGDKIEYTFTVKNTGEEIIKNISITDAKIGLVNAFITPSTLAIGATGTLTSANTYTITQADVIKGFVSNTATANGTNELNAPVSATSTNGNATTTVDPACPTCTITDIIKKSQISLVKTAVFNDLNNDTFTQAGETVTYTFNVTNTGNVNINNITLNDGMLGMVNVAINPTNLTPMQVGTYSLNYVLTQADIDRGFLSNTAIANGVDELNTNISDTSGTSVNNNIPTVIIITKTPSMTLVKSSTIIDVNNNGLNDVGDKINYTFTVKNTGNVTLTNITVNDAKAVIMGGPVVSLSPLAVDNTTFTATYIITQADLEKGFVYNTATAIASSPGKTDDVTATSTNGNPAKPTDVIDPTCPTCTITPIEQKGKIALVKKVTNVGTGVNGTFLVGDIINYSFTITNVGNLTLNTLVLTDPLFIVNNIPLISTTLLPQATTTAFGNYTITALDAAKGEVKNQALVTSLDLKNNVVQDISGSGVNADDATITQLAKPPIAVNDLVTPKQNTTQIIEVLKNDIGVSVPLVVSTVTIITPPLIGTALVNADGTVTYTTTPGYTGSDLFTYTVKDANGFTSNTAIVTINVAPTSPIAVDDSTKTEISKLIFISLLISVFVLNQ